MNNSLSTRDLPQITIGVVFILLMIIGSVWVFMPFVAALLWATIIVISTYNLMLKLQKLLWNKKGLSCNSNGFNYFNGNSRSDCYGCWDGNYECR